MIFFKYILVVSSRQLELEFERHVFLPGNAEGGKLPMMPYTRLRLLQGV